MDETTIHFIEPKNLDFRRMRTETATKIAASGPSGNSGTPVEGEEGC
jgi:hypothetical protein